MVIIVDEVTFLTACHPDNNLSEKVKAALPIGSSWTWLARRSDCNCHSADHQWAIGWHLRG